MGFVRRVLSGALAVAVVICVATALGAEEKDRAPRGMEARERSSASVKLPIVVLDPGHGGPDTGGAGPGGLTEAEVVWAVASELKLLLESEQVARVVLTRSSRNNPSLAERTAVGNGLGASLFVSLHTGAAFHPGAKGASVYLASEPGRAGHVVLNGTPPEFFRPTRRRAKSSRGSPVRWEAVHSPHRAASHRACVAILAALKNGGVLKARGLHEADLPVLQGSATPACLVEVATLSHPTDEAALRQASTRQALVKSLARGLRAALEAGR